MAAYIGEFRLQVGGQRSRGTTRSCELHSKLDVPHFFGSHKLDGGTGGTTQVPLVFMLIRSEIASGQCFVSYFCRLVFH